MEGPRDERAAFHLRGEGREGRSKTELSYRHLAIRASTNIVDPLLYQPVKGFNHKEESDGGYKSHLHILVKSSQEDESFQHHVPRLLYQMLGERERGKEESSVVFYFNVYLYFSSSECAKEEFLHEGCGEPYHHCSLDIQHLKPQ